MPIDPLSIARISNLYRDTLAVNNIDTTQTQLAGVEQQLSTGKAVNSPGDDPTAAASIEQLQTTLSFQARWTTNLTQGTARLNQVDSSLGNVTSLLTQAESIASANQSTTVSAAARSGAAAVVDSLYDQALSSANSQYDGTYLYGGADAGSPPFVGTPAGLTYNGSDATLGQTFDQATDLSFQVSATAAFGGESASVSTGTDLGPAVAGAQRIADLRGANGSGVKLGVIKIGNGAATKSVDLSGADSVQDVIDDINAAAVPGVTAGLTAAGIKLTASPTADVTVTDVTGGTTASDLGIARPTGGGAGAGLTGGPIGAEVTPFTPLASLRGGAGVDTTGFKISNGTASKTIALAGLATVQDLINTVNGSGLGVRASISADGTGIDLKNVTQGPALTVSEVGGTTATELGFRTFGPATLLSSLNGGKGVDQTAGQQFRVVTADGSTVDVSLSGAKTVQDAIDQINAAAGGKVTASFSTNGNGVVLTDGTTGGGTLTLTQLNATTTAADLGLTAAAVAGKIVGTDVAGVKAAGIFADLDALRKALRADDTAGITAAAGAIQADQASVGNLQGVVGARTQELTSRTTEVAAQNVATQSLLSNFRDVDYTAAITRFQALQNGLQASLAVTAKSLNLSLLNYL